MKVMSNTLYLVVAAVVIVVTAVVVLAIFLNVIPIATGLTEAKAICQTQAVTACSTFGELPPTWNVQSMNVIGADGKVNKQSCKQIVAGPCECKKEEKKLIGAGCAPEPEKK